MSSILLMLLCSCNFFELRDSEEPVKPSKWNEPCITWEQSLENVYYAYTEFQNWDRYETQFTDDFRFYFSAQDVNDYNIGTFWNRDQERNVLYDLHNWAESMVPEFFEVEQGDDIGENEVKIYRSYILNVYRNATESQYRGNLEIHFRKENGIWKIRYWYDYRNSQNPTWGKLKYDIAM
jgi:hypothetical protein